MGIRTTADDRAAHLLEQMREAPMRRGALSPHVRPLRRDIARTMADEGVPQKLAQRVSFQLVFKFHRRELFDQPEWVAIGRHLVREMALLRERAGMRDTPIIAVLPKLSAEQLIDFLDELLAADRRIARTIFHAALTTADPLEAGRRYLAEYRLVARRLQSLDPSMARTVAAASFSAVAPLNKALEHLERFTSLMAKYQEDAPAMARRMARASFRAR
jgi:hypothetical protein